MQIVLQQTFEVEHCCNCGVAFAIPADLVRVLRKTHRSFYCPNGHAQSYVRQTEAERLEAELARQQKENRALADKLLQEVEAAARVKKRIAAGVCPCCNRTFENVARHMANKHKNHLPAVNKHAVKLLQ